MSTFDATRSEETIFTWGAPPLKFGPGAADEIGFDLAQYGVQRALVLTDQGVGQSGVAHRIADALTRYGITSGVFDGVHVEPTDDSINKAGEYARAQGPWDGFVAVGGGSVIDTAKAVNLLTNLAEQLAAPRDDPWETTGVIEELKVEARRRGLWNLFLPHSPLGAGLSNLQL